MPKKHSEKKVLIIGSSAQQNLSLACGQRLHYHIPHVGIIKITQALAICLNAPVLKMQPSEAIAVVFNNCGENSSITGGLVSQNN